MVSVLKITCQVLRGIRDVKVNKTSFLPLGSFMCGAGDRPLRT